MSNRSICIIASSQSQESIHSHLITSHVFDNTVHLKSPDKEVRRVILEEAVCSLDMEKDDAFDMLEIAGSTEGYQPGDLWTLAERSKHQAIVRHVENMNLSKNPETAASVNIIKQADFENALAGFVPASLRGVKLQRAVCRGLKLVGLKKPSVFCLKH